MTEAREPSAAGNGVIVPLGRPAAPARREPRRRRRGRPAVSLISEFQPDAIELDERPPHRASRLILYCLAALIVSALTWASLSHVNTFVTATGKLITKEPNIVVQPLETSVIRKIRVNVGDVVHRGQVLGILDPTFTQADLRRLQFRVSALEAAVKRLKIELGESAGELDASTNPDDAIQAKLLSEHKAYYDAQVLNYKTQIAGALAGLKASKNEESVLAQRLKTLRSIETMRDQLMKRELGSRLNFLLAHDARLEVENNLARIRGNQADYRHRAQKAVAEMEAFIQDFRRTAQQELVDTLAKRDSAEEDLKKAMLRRKLVVLKSPVDAVVLQVPNRTIGSVVREAEPMFVLVRRHGSLQAEVKVAGKDIGQVAVGQLVRLKLDAYPFQKYGTLEGHVAVISRDSFAPGGNSEKSPGPSAPFYRVLINLQDARDAERVKGIRLIPGMSLTAELEAGNRSVISYFLYPLLRGMDESIREP